MDSNRTSGGVTISRHGAVGPDGELVGYLAAGTMLDPGPPLIRDGFEERLRGAIEGEPELVAAQIAGVRRMLLREVPA